MKAIDRAIRILDSNQFEDEVKLFEGICRRIQSMSDKEEAGGLLREKYRSYIREIEAIFNQSKKDSSAVSEFNKAHKKIDEIRDKCSRSIGG